MPKPSPTAATSRTKSTGATPLPAKVSRNACARLGRALYGVYALALLALLVSFAAVLALLLPKLSWRRATTRALARAWLRWAGLRVHTTGIESLPPGNCVLVANHSSYLDGIVMKAVLPPRFSFVIKREASTMPVLGLLLRRIGSEFVDRHSTHGRHRAARRVVRRAEAGHSLVFFPEGTFDAQVGIKRFKIGAFVAAARGNVPVVAAAIHGARRALPTGTVVPWPGHLHVEVLSPIGGHGETPESLRDEARRRILERLDEPDVTRQAVA